jgi:F-box protein 9
MEVSSFSETLYASRWRTLQYRELVEMTYIPPQVPDLEVLRTILERRAIDFRRVYVEHPRMRMDGVYIAICQYV